MDAPPIQYARTEDGVNIAYWTLGSGPPLVLLPAAPTVSASIWSEVGESVGFSDRLAERNTVVLFDQRGFGLSETATVPVSIDDRIADLDAVVDALGHERFALWGEQFNTPMAITYAVRRPDRVSHLILWNGIPSWNEYIQSPQAQTLAVVREQGDWKTFTETVAQVSIGWSEPELTQRLAARLRASTDQETFLASVNSTVVGDVSDLLARVSTPTLVFARQDCYYGIGGSQMLATKIPNARMVVLPGTSTFMLAGDVEAVGPTLDDFLGSHHQEPDVSPTGSSFRTILFTDVVASTPLLAQLKDAKMREVMRDHDAVLDAAVTEHGGRVVKEIGDAFMVEFAIPSAAVECAIAIQRGIREQFADSDVPIRLRIGINAGEPVAEDGDLHGASVNIAKRLESAAPTNGILVSDVVKQAVVGKDFEFADQGEVALKGFDDPVRAWSVEWA